jgi:hypothetical protein
MEKRFAWWSNGQRARLNIETFGASDSEFEPWQYWIYFFHFFYISNLREIKNFKISYWIKNNCTKKVQKETNLGFQSSIKMLNLQHLITKIN